MSELQNNPYDTICNFYESILPHVGRRVMKLTSLSAVSIFLPHLIGQDGKRTHSRIHTLYLSPPGSGKTSMAEFFQKISYNPIPFESTTDSALDDMVRMSNRLTIIVSDIARIFRDTVLSKQIENLIGDESKISRFTRKTGYEEIPVDIVGYFAGTPSNLSSTIKDGLIFRVSPILFYPTEQEHTDILEKVNETIGTGELEDNKKERDIIDFYKGLVELNTTEEVTRPIIPEYFREEIKDKLIPYFQIKFKETETSFVRELNQCYRYMFSHAFLNRKNRKIEDSAIVLEEADLRVALHLSEQEVKTKVSIIKCMNILSENKLKRLYELENYLQPKIAKDVNYISIDEHKILKSILRAR